MALDLAPASGPSPQVVGGYWLGDIRQVFASPERARTDLGFVAQVSFERGMAEFRTVGLRQMVGLRPIGC